LTGSGLVAGKVEGTDCMKRVLSGTRSSVLTLAIFGRLEGLPILLGKDVELSTGRQTTFVLGEISVFFSAGTVSDTLFEVSNILGLLVFFSIFFGATGRVDEEVREETDRFIL
jgi:hypothetical protein